jgi:hypothetical protein
LRTSTTSATEFELQEGDTPARPLPGADPAAAPFMAAAALFALAVASADLLTYHVNLPIVYIVPLLLVERAGSRRLLWQAAGLLVALTFAGYFFGRYPDGAEPWQTLASARFANRALAALALLAAAGVLHAGITMRERARAARHLWPHDPDGLSYARAVMAINRVVAPVLAALLVVVLFVSDAVTQAEYNIAVLYALPLMILARARSRAIMWVALPVLLAVTMLGIWVGPSPEPQHLWNLVLNRVLVCIAMVTTAVLLHVRFGDPGAASRGYDLR